MVLLKCRVVYMCGWLKRSLCISSLRKKAAEIHNIEVLGIRNSGGGGELKNPSSVSFNKNFMQE